MVESLDAYRIAKYLRSQGYPDMEVSTVYENYTSPVQLTEGFPAMMMNTTGPDHTCIFLKEGRCSIYPARPRTCRHYPFSVGPGRRGRDFAWFLCMDKPFHLTDGRVLIKDWVNQNFPREEREFLKQEYEFYERLGKLLRSMDDQMRDQCLKEIVYYCYVFYDLDEPFLPQHLRNISILLEHLTHMVKNKTERE